MGSDCVPLGLLSLPTEIIDCVFEYLRPLDLIQSFGLVSNKRLHSLFGSRISTLDLIGWEDSWSKWLVPSLIALRQYVKQISIDAAHATQLLGAVPILDALTIRLTRETQHVIDDIYNSLQSIKALTLTTVDGSLQTTTVELLLTGQNGSPKHTLNIDSRIPTINFKAISLSSSLRHLDLIVPHEDILYQFCAHLPKLETIRVTCMPSAPDTDSNRANTAIETMAVASSNLRSISINGSIADFDRLTRCFQLASASLTDIHLEISPRYLVEPDQINQIPLHLNFKLDVSYMHMGIVYDFDWRSYVDRFTTRPVVRYNNESFCDLSSLSQKSVFWLETTNMVVTAPAILCFPRVHTLEFQYLKLYLDTEAIQFIRQTFPHIRMLVWRLSPPNVEGTLTLDTVNALEIYSSHRKTLKPLLQLCPSVHRLSFTRVFDTCDQLPDREETDMHHVGEQIKLVELTPGDKVEQNCVRELFPNAKITYDALPFGVDALWSLIHL